MACFHGLATDIVLELLLVDLPIRLEDRACRTPTDGGASLWFLVCECNDRYLNVLETLVSMCSYQQVYELAFSTRDESRTTLITSATPQCAEFLTVSLLFVGRFEFLAYAPIEATPDVKTFDALDCNCLATNFRELMTQWLMHRQEVAFHSCHLSHVGPNKQLLKWHHSQERQ